MSNDLREAIPLAWSNLEGTKFCGNGDKWKHASFVVPLYAHPPVPLKDLTPQDIYRLATEHLKCQIEGPEVSNVHGFVAELIQFASGIKT